MAMKSPPGFTWGRQSSARISSSATARLTTMSKRSRSSGLSSTRALRQVTSPRPSSSQVRRTKSSFFDTLSTAVRARSGVRMRRGTPGKPAPQPTSRTRFPRKSARVSRAALSRKCSRAASAGSRMAVRFMTAFFSISAAPYCAIRRTAPMGGSMPIASRPWVRISSIRSPSEKRGMPSGIPLCLLVRGTIVAQAVRLFKPP